MNNGQRIPTKAFIALEFAFLTICGAALSLVMMEKSIYRMKKIRKLLKLRQFFGSKM